MTKTTDRKIYGWHSHAWCRIPHSDNYPMGYVLVYTPEGAVVLCDLYTNVDTGAAQYTPVAYRDLTEIILP